MSKIVRKSAIGRLVTIKRGVMTGVIDMLDVTGAPRYHHIPGAGRSSSEAFRGDWKKLGKDFRRAVEKVEGGA